MTSLFVSKTIRNKDKIILDGYSYIVNKKTGAAFYWVCTEKRDRMCRGTLVSSVLENGQVTVKKVNKEHNHLPVCTTKEVDARVHALREKAFNTSESNLRLVRSVKRGAGDEGLVALPSDQALTKKIKRLRQKNRGTENLRGIDSILPERFRHLDGQPFLIGDFQSDDKRALLFSTPELMKMMVKAEVIIMDGTFKISPTSFRQLYTLHAGINVDGE